MANYTFGFIGTGNMGSALAKAAVKHVSPDKIILSNRTAAKAETLAAQLGCAAGDSAAVAAQSDYIFLGVKPQMMARASGGASAGPSCADRSLRPGDHGGRTNYGADRRYGRRKLPRHPHYAQHPLRCGSRVCSTTPTLWSPESSWISLPLPWREPGCWTGWRSGLSTQAALWRAAVPAFLSLFLEALADGGVTCGLPRQKALTYAAKMAEGTAKLMLETNQHPGVMKDAVCSPAGSTIAGVRALEEHAFRAAAMDAVISAMERNRELGK